MKTLKEIKTLRIKIEEQLEKLPDKNIFGGSNSQEKKEMLKFIIELKLLENENYITSCEEVDHWIRMTGYSTLDDYLN